MISVESSQGCYESTYGRIYTDGPRYNILSRYFVNRENNYGRDLVSAPKKGKSVGQYVFKVVHNSTMLG